MKLIANQDNRNVSSDTIWIGTCCSDRREFREGMRLFQAGARPISGPTRYVRRIPAASLKHHSPCPGGRRLHKRFVNSDHDICRHIAGLFVSAEHTVTFSNRLRRSVRTARAVP